MNSTRVDLEALFSAALAKNSVQKLKKNEMSDKNFHLFCIIFMKTIVVVKVYFLKLYGFCSSIITWLQKKLT